MATKKTKRTKHANGIYIWKGVDGHWYIHIYRQGDIIVDAGGYNQRKDAVSMVRNLRKFLSTQTKIHLGRAGDEGEMAY